MPVVVEGEGLKRVFLLAQQIVPSLAQLVMDEEFAVVIAVPDFRNAGELQRIVAQFRQLVRLCGLTLHRYGVVPAHAVAGSLRVVLEQRHVIYCRYKNGIPLEFAEGILQWY